MEIYLDFPYRMVLKDEYTVLKPDVSEEEFWEMSNEDTNFELLDGVLYIHSPASTEHEEIFQFLLITLSYYLETSKSGKVFGSRLVMRLGSNWIFEPDLQILTPDRYPQIKETHVEGAANVVIEILSKSTREADIQKKLPQYLKSGVEEVWIVDPSNQTITLHWVNETISWDKAKESISLDSKVFPNLQFLPEWLWNRKNTPISQIISQLLR
jgi:Uma2 family endonuclease